MIAAKDVRLINSIAVLVALLMCVVSLAVGQFPISVSDLLTLMRAAIFGGAADVTTNADIVLFDIRLPRMLAAFSVGAALAAAGAAYQNLFRNPLVSPDILGVSSGAALGAVLAIYLTLPLLLIQLSAFVGGVVAVALIYLISHFLDQRHVGDNNRVLTLVLTGVVIASLFGAGVALTKYLADPYQQLPAISYWLMGSFVGITHKELAFALPLMAIGLLPLFLLRWRINILSLGDDEARALGLNLAATRMVIIIAATLITAIAVAICGVVGWVGLIIPHAVKIGRAHV